MSNPLTVFVTTSSMNAHAAKAVMDELTLRGHAVPDWTRNADMLSKFRVGDTPAPLLPAEQSFFEGVTTSAAMADLMVAVLPLDLDATFLVATAHISGVPVAVLRQEPAYGGIPLVLRGCTNFWCDDVEALLKVISEWPSLAEDLGPVWPSQVNP